MFGFRNKNEGGVDTKPGDLKRPRSDTEVCVQQVFTNFVAEVMDTSEKHQSN